LTAGWGAQKSDATVPSKPRRWFGNASAYDFSTTILRLLAFLTNRRNQNAPPVERINSTTAFAPLNNVNAVVILSRKKAAASVAKR